MPATDAGRPASGPGAESSRSVADRVAHTLSEVVAPPVLAFVLPLVVGAATVEPWWQGLGWGALTVFFFAVVPYGVLRLLMARGLVDGGHHIPDRMQRRLPFAFGLASVLVGLGVLVALGAPATVLAGATVMLGIVVAIGAVNLAWKLSGHASVAAASAVVLVQVFGPLVLFAAVPIVLATGWARIRVRAHSPAQVLAGLVVGTAVGALVWPLVA